jgi:membrane fusion protein (multidrug efflux system)
MSTTAGSHLAPAEESSHHRSPPDRRVPITVAAAVGLVLLVGGAMVLRAGRQVNKIALAQSPKGVTVAEAKSALYRPLRRYVGTVEPWVRANVGPQIISGYVDTVLVRPGDVVTRGQILATLDCRNASAQSRAIQMQARAIQAEQEALAHEASRMGELEQGGFASPNEIERKRADSASKAAELEATQARIMRAGLEVGDCVLRAPFSGEIADRLKDPGAFVHPGDSLVVLVDRNTVRVTADVPEGDFELVRADTPVRIRALATGKDLTGKVSRRSPSADESTRTIHLEIDVPDPARSLPVGTTAELTVEVGEPVSSSTVPLVAATIRGQKATLFVVDEGTARKQVVSIKGERGSMLFLDPVLRPGTRVVTEGRAILKDGDRVEVKPEIAEVLPTPPGPRPVSAEARP